MGGWVCSRRREERTSAIAKLSASLPRRLRMRSALSHVALAGLIGHFGHAAVQQFARAVDDGIPLEGRTGIRLVGLNMVMTKNAFVLLQFIVRQFLWNQFPIRVMGIVALNFWKHFAKRRGQLNERFILLGSEIVLYQIIALNRPANQLRARGMTHKTFVANAAVAELPRDCDAHLAIGIFGVPFL